MKKSLYISLVTILTFNLFSDQSLTLPLENKFLSTENGGNLSAIDAYSDGIGLYTVGEEDKKFKAMNELVFVYGEEAKKSGETLKEFVLENGSIKEQELASLLGTNSSGTVIGGVCDDGNPYTENDVYIDINGTCQGTEIVVNNSVNCKNESVGSEILVDGVFYLVVDNNTIKGNLSRAETLCTSNVTNMSNLFQNATSFNKDISKWDTSNVTNMSTMFFTASAFNQDISKWDTSKVTDMSYMFFKAENFNQDISSWNVSNVINMRVLFQSATLFNQDIGSWDTSKVTNMSYMFYNAVAFNQDISKWDTSNVTNMSNMFYNAAAFNQDISKWDTSKVTDMAHMFTNANSFNKDIGSWNTENVTNMYYMFFNTPAFNQNISNWEVEKVTSWTNFRLYSLLSLVNTPLKFR